MLTRPEVTRPRPEITRPRPEVTRPRPRPDVTRPRPRTSRLKANKAKGSSIYYVTTGGVRGLVTFGDKGVGSKMAPKSVT